MDIGTARPTPQEKRLTAYLEGLARAAGHADRNAPLQKYCLGLLLPGERKSVEPMAARLAPENVRRMHQSLHHVVADGPWSDEAVMTEVRGYALTSMRRQSPVQAWIVDDTGFPKKGKHSVGVARQYCGQVGKQENCRVAVSLSIATGAASLPIAWRLYLPQIWSDDQTLRKRAGVPEEIVFQTKPAIALEQIRAAVQQGIFPSAGVGRCCLRDGHAFPRSDHRVGATVCAGHHVFGERVETGRLATPEKGTESDGPSDQTAAPGCGSPARGGESLGAVAARFRLESHRLAAGYKAETQLPLCRGTDSSGHRDYWRSEPHAEEWLLIEWPQGEEEPTKYWLSTLPAKATLRELAHWAKQRWIIERDYEKLKQELGLGHFEGRGWRGFHHHATLCIAAYGFLVAERSRFSPSARAGKLDLRGTPVPTHFQPRGAPRPGRAA